MTHFHHIPQTPMLFAVAVIGEADDPKFIHLRVIGWRLAPGYAPFPVVIGAPGSVRGIAVIAPDEGGGTGVRSCLTGKFYDSKVAWYDAEEGHMNPAGPVAAEAAPSEEASLGSLDILFADRAFKKQSFWRYNGPERVPFMFVVDAEDYIPDDPRIDKITGDDFRKNRHTVDVVAYADLFTEEQPRAEEPETPDAEGDDDPGDDLI